MARWTLFALTLTSIPLAHAQVVQTFETTIDQTAYQDHLFDARMSADGVTTFCGALQLAPDGPPWPVPFNASIGRVDAQGAVVWLRSYSPVGLPHTIFVDLELGDAGSAIVLGDASLASSGPLIQESHLLRYDAGGTPVWTAVRSGVKPFALAIDPTGDIWVTGETVGGDVAILRYDPNGLLRFATSWSGPYGGPDYGFSIAPDGQGGAYVTGEANDATFFGSSLIVLRVDAAGNTLWAGVLPTRPSRGFDVAVDASSNAYACGTIRVGSLDAFGVVRYDANGTFAWQQTSTDPAHMQGKAWELAVDPRGDVVAAGAWWTDWPEIDVLVQKFGPAGNTLWSTSWNGPFGGVDYATRLWLDGAGEVYVAGSTPRAGTGDNDALALRLTQGGAVSWARSFGLANMDDRSYAIGTGPIGTAFAVARTDYYGWSNVMVARFDETAVPFCFGDGSGTPCPCGNSTPSYEREGCASSFGVGGRATAEGASSLSAETLVLHGSGMPDSSALYFQGAGSAAGGTGVVFGDGLRCASAPFMRLSTKTNAGGASRYPEPGDAPVSVRGGVTGPGERTYQVWYRNAASFCTSATFNLTNGLRVTWIP